MMQSKLGGYRKSRGFTLVEIVLAILVLGVIITFVVIVVVSGGDDSDASIPDAVCDTTLTLSGETENAEETSRFGPHRNWPAARTGMRGRVRTEAETKALASLNSEFSGYSCLQECPNVTRSNNVTYNTTSAVSGESGFAWIKYDAQASSQASEDFTCTASAPSEGE